MLSKKFFLISMLAVMLIATSGCVSFKTGPTTPKGFLGVFESIDSGTTWKLRGGILNTQGKIYTLGGVTINKIVLDPNDNQAIYLATNTGLYYSYDGGEGWTQVKYFAAKQIDAIAGVAVDYFNKCTIFVSAANKIYKSTDCSRSFSEVYVDTTREGLVITNISTEYYNNNVVYATTSKGDILKSDDYGVHWRLLKSIGDSIKQILVDKDDTRIVYFLTEKKGLFKTADGGATWSDDMEVEINKKKVKDPINRAIAAIHKDGKVGKYLAQDMTKKDTIILACKWGLIKTTDGGMTWTDVPLVTPDRGANIFSLVIDPKNGNNIFYGTDTTLYKSDDGGNTWQTQKAPTVGYINFLLIDPKDSKIIYLGGKEIPKK